MAETAHDRGASTEFVDVLMRQGRGSTNQELSDNLREIVQRVQSTGKKGTLTLSLSVELVKSTNSLVVCDKITAKLPEYDRPSAVFFADKNGNLLTDDPDQPSIFDLAEVADPGDDVVDLSNIDPKTGEILEPTTEGN